MGSSSTKFKKYIQHGDEFAAMQVRKYCIRKVRKYIVFLGISIIQSHYGSLPMNISVFLREEGFRYLADLGEARDCFLIIIVIYYLLSIT